MHRRPFALSGALALALSGPTVAQEAVPPPQQTITDFSAREIPADKQVVMSQETEVLEGVDPATVPHYQVDPFWPKPLPNNWILGQVVRAWLSTSAGTSGSCTGRGSLSDREVGAQQNPPISKCCYAAPPVLVFDQAGNLVRCLGRAGRRATTGPRASTASIVDDDDFVWLGRQRRQGPPDPQVHARRQVPACRSARSGQSKGSNDTANLGSPADIDVDVAARRGLRRRRLPQPARHRLRLRDRRLQAPLGRLRQAAERRQAPPYDPARPPSQQFGNPVHCVRFSNDGLVYVCDRNNDRFQVFEKDGTFVEEAFSSRHSAVRLGLGISVLSTTPSSASSSWSMA